MTPRVWESRDRVGQNARRALRRQLGLCIFCIEKARPGYTRCQKHLDKILADQRNVRARQQKARGWKIMRVKV